MALTSEQKQIVAGTTIQGASTGAMIGTMFLPGAGTAAGAALGAGVGTILGLVMSSDMDDAREEEERKMREVASASEFAQASARAQKMALLASSDRFQDEDDNATNGTSKSDNKIQNPIAGAANQNVSPLAGAVEGGSGTSGTF